MSSYQRPKKRIHRGFFYLNDETVINSLSAIESGKIDEVVARVNTAREGGFGAGAGFYGVKAEAARKSSSELEEEITRIRTRFSVFELWYQALLEQKAIGTFDGWGAAALDGVEPGETVEFRAVLQPAPLQNLLRLFLWFAERAKSPNSPFSQKAEALKQTKESERTIKAILGSEDAIDEFVLLARPLGEPGPKVAMPISKRWLIGNLGRLGGEFGVVAQVDQVLRPGEELPVLRLTSDVSPTKLEIDAMRGMVAGFVEPASELGVIVSDGDAVISGPALWLDPIAIYR